MEFMFFHPGKIDSLAMFFQDDGEKEAFFSELDESTKKYLIDHSHEFRSKEELEIAVNRLQTPDAGH